MKSRALSEISVMLPFFLLSDDQEFLRHRLLSRISSRVSGNSRQLAFSFKQLSTTLAHQQLPSWASDRSSLLRDASHQQSVNEADDAYVLESLATAAIHDKNAQFARKFRARGAALSRS